MTATAPLSGISKTMRATPARTEGPRFWGRTVDRLDRQTHTQSVQTEPSRQKPIDLKCGDGPEAKVSGQPNRGTVKSRHTDKAKIAKTFAETASHRITTTDRDKQAATEGRPDTQRGKYIDCVPIRLYL